MTQIDAKKVFVGTKYSPKVDEKGHPELNADGSQVGGTFEITLYNLKDSSYVDSWSKEFSTNKYLAFLEDFNGLTAEEVVDEYFTGNTTVDTGEVGENNPDATNAVERDVVAAQPEEVSDKLDLTLDVSKDKKSK